MQARSVSKGAAACSNNSGVLAATAGYEPMRHKRPPSNDRINAVEQVRLIEEVRLQKEAI